MDPKMIQQFEDETGIEVKYEEAVTPEEMYSKYSSGVIDYDLLCTSDYMLKKLIDEGSVQPVDFDSFEYGGNIGDDYWNFAKSFDEENQYVLPYFWGTIGILYDTTKVNETPDSWDVLFNGEYAGEIGINGINKATGMERYLKAAGIAREDSIDVGDGPNDLQMMEYAGIGIAMGNAREEVKERADMVTSSIDDDGIYRAFETLGLLA